MNKDIHEDHAAFEHHPPQQHSVLHPGLSRPLPPQTLQTGGPRQIPQGPHHPGKETRPSVIESSQPHIIECT